MKQTLLLIGAMLPFCALANESIEEKMESKKISEKTYAYGNGVTSALLLSKFSKFQPVVKSDNEELNELEVLYANATLQMIESNKAHEEEIGQMANASKEAELAKEKYRLELEKLQAGLAQRLTLGELDQSYYYATAEWELTQEQEDVLAVVFDAISQMKGVKVEVIGRADPRGNKEYNQKLSEKRAEFIRQLAISKGIPEADIDSRGVGEVGEITKNREHLFFNRYTSVTIKR